MSPLTLRLPHSQCAVLFDVDGTIVDSHPLHFEAYARALAEVSDIRIDWNEYVDKCLREGRKFEDLVAEYDTTCDGRALHAAKTEWLKKLGKGRLKLRIGLPELWMDLALNEARLALVSTARKASLETLQGLCPLPTPSDVVVCRETVGSRIKPDPFAFRHAAEKISVAPERCLVIEDAPVGVFAAKEAGMCCIALRTPIFGDIDLAHADARFDRFSDLKVFWDRGTGKISIL